VRGKGAWRMLEDPPLFILSPTHYPSNYITEVACRKGNMAYLLSHSPFDQSAMAIPIL